MGWSDLSQWFGNNALALYAAALSTFLAVVNIRSSRPRMQIVMVHGAKGEDHGFYVQIINPSAHPVHAHHVWLLYQYQPYRLRDLVEDVARFRTWSPSWGWCHSEAPIDENNGLPVTIAPYTAHRVFIPIDKLRIMFLDAIHPRVRAVVQDALGRNHYSPQFNTGMDFGGASLG